MSDYTQQEVDALVKYAMNQAYEVAASVCESTEVLQGTSEAHWKASADTRAALAEAIRGLKK